MDGLWGAFFEMVYDHHRDFSFVNVLPHVPFGALEFFPLQVKQVILDLKRYTQVLDKLAQEESLLSWGLDVSTHHSGNQSSQNSGLVRCHLQILLLAGVLAIEFLMIVPQNVPPLSNMQLHDFLQVDLHQLILESFGVAC